MYEKDTGTILILKIIFYPIGMFIIKSLLLIYLTLISLLNYLFHSIFNLLNLLGIWMTLGMACFWARIIYLTSQLDLVDYDDKSTPKRNNIELMSDLKTQYLRYSYWQAASIFIAFWRLFQYLKFSKSMNRLKSFY